MYVQYQTIRTQLEERNDRVGIDSVHKDYVLLLVGDFSAEVRDKVQLGMVCEDMRELES